MSPNKTSVIMSGADEEIFNKHGIEKYNAEKIKFVTHHWSAHTNKGFDIYKEFDDLLSESKYQNLEFSYIGNVPPEVSFVNTTVIEPLSGIALANEIKKNNIYLTASINEPSGNHHIEAAQCGLPILYLDSGGIPEYCDGFGVSFKNDFKERLEEIINNYNVYKSKLDDYPFSAQLMCKEFLDKFIDVKSKKTFLNTDVNWFIMNAYLFQTNLQKMVRSITIKQYFKNFLKRIIK